MEKVKTKGFTAKDEFNSANSLPIKTAKNSCIEVVDLMIKDKLPDEEGNVETVGFMKAKDGKLKKPYIAFLSYTFVVNLFSMCMENAKGAFLSLAAFVAIGAFFIVLRKMLKKGKKAILSGAVWWAVC